MLVPCQRWLDAGAESALARFGRHVSAWSTARTSARHRQCADFGGGLRRLKWSTARTSVRHRRRDFTRALRALARRAKEDQRPSSGTHRRVPPVAAVVHKRGSARTHRRMPPVAARTRRIAAETRFCGLSSPASPTRRAIAAPVVAPCARSRDRGSSPGQQGVPCPQPPRDRSTAARRPPPATAWFARRAPGTAGQGT